MSSAGGSPPNFSRMAESTFPISVWVAVTKRTPLASACFTLVGSGAVYFFHSPA